MSVTAAEVLTASRLRAAALTGETAGYLVLLAAEASARAGGVGSLSRIHLTEDGTLTLDVDPARSLIEQEGTLRLLLAELLTCTPPAAPALGSVARGNAAGLPRLVAEIEAALIPVNRAAARRALARLHRDVGRARASGKLGAASAAPAMPAAGPIAPPLVEPPQARATSRATAPVAGAVLDVELEAPPQVLLAGQRSLGAEEMAPVAVGAPVAPLRATIPRRALDVPSIERTAVPPAVILVAPAAPAPEAPAEARPDPEPTPFLGSLVGAAPLLGAARGSVSFEALPPVEPDTERVPEVVVVAPMAAAWPELPLVEVVVPPVVAAAPAEGHVAAPAEVEPLAEIDVDVYVAAPAEVAARVEDEFAALAGDELAALAGDELAALAGDEAAALAGDELAALAGDELAIPADVAAPAEIDVAAPAEIDAAAPAEIDAAAPPELVGEPLPSAAALEVALAAVVPPPAEIVVPAPAPEPPPPRPTYRPRRSDVGDLLDGFAVTEARTLKEISRELKQIAGVSGTPCPPPVTPLSLGRSR